MGIKKGVKAQVSMEFMIFIGVSIIIVLFFVSTTTSQVIELNKEKQKLDVDEIAHYIQTEIFIAYNTHNGYAREFEIPTQIGNDDYTIEVDDDYIYVEYREALALLKIPKFNGVLVKGKNIIRKIDDEIYIN